MRREDPLDPSKYEGERLAAGLRIMAIDRMGLPGLMEDTDETTQYFAERREARSRNWWDLSRI